MEAVGWVLVAIPCVITFGILVDQMGLSDTVKMLATIFILCGCLMIGALILEHEGSAIFTDPIDTTCD